MPLTLEELVATAIENQQVILEFELKKYLVELSG